MVEHSRSGEKHSTASRVFPYTSFVLYRFLRALQQNRTQSRLLYLLIKNRLSTKIYKFESLYHEKKYLEEENGEIVALQISPKNGESLYGLGRLCK